MSLLSKQIGAYVDELLETNAEIVHNDAADAFLTEHESMLDEYLIGIVRRYMRAEIKARSQAPSGPLGQGVLFAGLPAAITIREGVTKPLPVCTRLDLHAGRSVKVANIEHASAALEAYDADVESLAPHMPTDRTTVTQAAKSLKRRAKTG